MSTETSPTRFPENYDELLPVTQLIHGEHNPRKVSPTQELRESIQRDGIQQPLIVRPDSTRDRYHITDGWQRYQAATALGYEQLPVRVYESNLAALEATERTSIVREWSSYDWAQYCQSVASEVNAESKHQLIQEVADRTVKSEKTVKRYLESLALPEVAHPLFRNGPEGTDRQWLALSNYNDDVRRYAGLSWRVSARLGRHADDLTEDRVLGIAAQAVEYSSTEQALNFVSQSISDQQTPLQTIHQRVNWDGQHEKYLQLPQVTMEVDSQRKEALMKYCRENAQPLTEVIERQLREFLTEL